GSGRVVDAERDRGSLASGSRRPDCWPYGELTRRAGPHCLRRSDLPVHLRHPQRRARPARHLPAVQAHSAQAPHDRPVSGRADRGDGAAERRVPGHWEGDLIIGKNGTSCAATLVERMIGFTGLLALPSKHAETTADAVIEYFNELPEMMRASLARDQGSEMAQHSKVSLATSIP